MLELIWEYLEMSSREVLPEAGEKMLYMETYRITVLSALKYMLKMMEKLCSTLRSFLRAQWIGRRRRQDFRLIS